MTEQDPTGNGTTSPDLLVAQLEKSHGPVQWSDLQAHADREALFLFTGEETLPAVALAFARNCVDQVRVWQQTGELRRPTAEELERWINEPTRTFDSIVVQPFVLARPRTLPILSS